MPSAIGKRNSTCEVRTNLGFIGYAFRRSVRPGREIVRVFTNCQVEPGVPINSEPVSTDAANLLPPGGVRFLHAIDIVLEEGQCRLIGLNSLSAVRKFNRLIGALGERARENGQEPNWVFESIDNLLKTLALIKNSRDFTSGL